MNVKVETYNDPSMRETVGWEGCITIADPTGKGDGWCVFVPSDGGAPVVSERDEGPAKDVVTE